MEKWTKEELASDRYHAEHHIKDDGTTVYYC